MAGNERGYRQLDDAALVAIVDRLDQWWRITLRDRALLLTFWPLGLRGGAAAVLRRGDVILTEETLTLTVSRSKTDPFGRGRRYLLTAGRHVETCPVAAMSRYLAMRDAVYGADPAGALFPPFDRSRLESGGHAWREGAITNNEGRIVPPGIGTQTVSRILQRLARRGGLDQDLSSHSLRRGSAVALAEAGVPVEQVRELLGHRSIALTLHYQRRDVGRITDWLDL